MRTSGEQLDWAVKQIEQYVPRRDRTRSLNSLSSDDLYRRALNIAEFVRNLQGMLESIARRERRQSLLRSLAKFAEALRIEGD